MVPKDALWIREKARYPRMLYMLEEKSLGLGNNIIFGGHFLKEFSEPIFLPFALAMVFKIMLVLISWIK